MTPDTEFPLQHFLDAQERDYPRALEEIRNGEKQSHWIWYIFPQLAGLGRSEMAQRYALRNLEHARRYHAHPVLGARLREISAALLPHEGTDIATILPYPDDLKLQSSMTLFAIATDEEDSVFLEVLDAFYRGDQDLQTRRLLGLA